MAGTPPRCKQVAPLKCPAGMIGTPPRCKQALPLKCPAGTIGAPPNCKQVAPLKCPAGTIGTPPRCKKIEKGEVAPDHPLDRTFIDINGAFTFASVQRRSAVPPARS